MGRVTGEWRTSMDDATMDRARSRVVSKGVKGNMTWNLRIIPDLEYLYTWMKRIQLALQYAENVYIANFIFRSGPLT